MRLFKTKKRIEISKSFGNIKIESFHYAVPYKDSFKNHTEIAIWYNSDCENCPMGWEERGYEGECSDCGCLFDYHFNVPIWKCMLSRKIKRAIYKTIYKGR